MIRKIKIRNNLFMKSINNPLLRDNQLNHRLYIKRTIFLQIKGTHFSNLIQKVFNIRVQIKIWTKKIISQFRKLIFQALNFNPMMKLINKSRETIFQMINNKFCHPILLQVTKIFQGIFQKMKIVIRDEKSTRTIRETS